MSKRASNERTRRILTFYCEPAVANSRQKVVGFTIPLFILRVRRRRSKAADDYSSDLRCLRLYQTVKTGTAAANSPIDVSTAYRPQLALLFPVGSLGEACCSIGTYSPHSLHTYWPVKYPEAVLSASRRVCGQGGLPWDFQASRNASARLTSISRPLMPACQQEYGRLFDGYSLRSWFRDPKKLRQ